MMGGVDWMNLAQDRYKWQSFWELNNETWGFIKSVEVLDKVRHNYLFKKDFA
jgi:hypothetical protein